MTPASKLQNYLRKQVEATGGNFRCAEWRMRDGCPDCYCWWPGNVDAWFEVKAGNDRLRPGQIRDLKSMQDCGLAAYVVHTETDVDFYVNELVRDAA